MTELSPTTAPPLRTDDDVARRVADLIGCAAGSDKLWLLFVDGDDRQAPVMMPVEEMSGPPDDEVVAALGDVLDGIPARAGHRRQASVPWCSSGNVAGPTTCFRPTVPGPTRS